jgi:hypothetical protein
MIELPSGTRHAHVKDQSQSSQSSNPPVDKSVLIDEGTFFVSVLGRRNRSCPVPSSRAPSEAAGNLFLPSENGFPSPAGILFSFPPGICSPARFDSRPDFGLWTSDLGLSSCPVPICPVPTPDRGLGHEFRGSPSYQKFVTRPNPWYFPLATSDTTRLPEILFSLVKKDPHHRRERIFVPGGNAIPGKGQQANLHRWARTNARQKKVPISIQPENSNSDKISFLRAEHFLGSPARGGTPIATRRQPVERNVHEIESPNGATEDSPSPPIPLPQGARGEGVSTTIRRVERTLGSRGSSPFDRIPSPLSPRGRGRG